MRADLLALSEAALVDLTNRGTVRRAQKETVEHTFTLRDDGTVIAEAADDVRCELLSRHPFEAWTCTCLAGHGCRHIVRAVLAYQAAHADGGLTAEGAPAVAPDPEPHPTGPFDPGTITDDALDAALNPAVRRASARLLAQGALGHVGLTNQLTVVRIHYPTPVTVRFLAGADLKYVRCTCRDPDPCAHVPLAVAIARGAMFGDTGLRAVDGDAWAPDTALLAEIRAALDELARVGVEASHRSMQGPWQRLRVRSEQAALPHVADLIGELLEEAARYTERATAFDPARLVALAGELLARVSSLGGTHPERIPDRLVAGALAQPTDVSRARLIGLGTEVLERGDQVLLRAHLVDARSGSPLRVTKRIDDEDRTLTSRLAGGLLAGIAFSQWGGGQVVVPAGKRFGSGDFTPGRGRVVHMPKADLASLSAPFLVGSVAELAAHHTRLPPALDDRAAGTDLAACRFTTVSWVGFDPGAQELVADLTDADGTRARLALPRTARVDVSATAELLTRWADEPPEQLVVAGRWRWSQHGATFLPLLLMGDELSLQPALAPPSEFTVGFEEAPDEPLTSPGALLRELDGVLGDTLVAGLERLRRDPRRWAEFAREAGAAGSVRIAGLARAVAEEPTPESVWPLVLLSVFGHPLA
ncbi:MAG: SWIM zinc finger family protein [Propionibacteriaceae bacterium]|nr:SWIM zinc finger family protein [Propionibacteriaceae bacterium]